MFFFMVGAAPVPPPQLLKGMHHRSEFHGERVCFLKVCMSAILKKRVIFWLKYSHFLEKGVYFPHTEQSPPQNSAFYRKRVTFESSEVISILRKSVFCRIRPIKGPI